MMVALVGALALIVNAGQSISLNGTWSLDYFPQPDDGAIRSLPVSIPMQTVKAMVPGNCELDLINAGILPQPEKGLNVLKLRPYEGYQWLYKKTFTAPKVEAGQRVMLTFNGVDTLADIFLNGEKIGEISNMLIPYSFNVTKKLKQGENTVQVLIRSVLMDAQYQTIGELGYTMSGGADGEPYRKAGHMGGWDIFPRAFVSGIWRDVTLEVQDAVRIDQPAWIIKNALTAKSTHADVAVACRVQAPFKYIGKAKVRFSLEKDGKVVALNEKPLYTYHCSVGVYPKKIELWWPKGMGAQPLYNAKIEVLDEDGKVLATNVERIGFRTIELERDDIYSKDRPGQFLFKVNGEPCYVRGSNWVPLDSFHSRDMQHLKTTLDMFNDLNCNMVRVWGGGVYEPDEFFDYCDEHGIMVWQDFMTGCSMFPQSDAYAKATHEEVLNIVLRYRNRASLVLWSGNNENDGAPSWRLGKRLARDPNKDRNSRVTIPHILWEFDVTRPYLPSSPYQSPDYMAGKAKMSEEHLWGARAYYKVPFYTNSPCWFASEMGYHGMPNRSSIEKMMTKDCVYPWVGNVPKFEKKFENLQWNDEWLLKASNPFLDKYCGLAKRNNLMTRQVTIMFGGVDTDLDTFIEQSQLVQAEAMKTFCELFRSRKFTRFNGLIWWNVRDGWPQISDAVVDYYNSKKPAYYALKAVQQNQLVMLRDDHSAWAVNDRLYPVKGHAKFTDKVSGKVLLECDYEVAANSKTRLGTVPFSGQGLINIEYTADGETLRNHFLYGEPPFNWKNVKEWMKGTVLHDKD